MSQKTLTIILVIIIILLIVAYFYNKNKKGNAVKTIQVPDQPNPNNLQPATQRSYSTSFSVSPMAAPASGSRVNSSGKGL